MMRVSVLMQMRYFGRSVAASGSVKRTVSKDEQVPIVRRHEPRRKELEEVFEPEHPKGNISVIGELSEAVDINGIPEEHLRRVARVYRPAREATQSAWGNTKAWRVELDNRERWENPLMGWCSSGDPLSNIAMTMKFASKEDAISFCVKNGWECEVQEPAEPLMKPKNYAENFAWNKRTRIGTK